MTCPVYHQRVSELKASVMRYRKRESTSLTNITRPFDTCLTRIWIEEEELLEGNSSFEGNMGIQGLVRVADVKEKKDEEIQECVC